MEMVNVNRKISDPFYRYKMPKIQAKIEGKGNGIKTVVTNMLDVAKSLSRPATYTSKYFGYELGAQTQCDLKNEKYMINGSHSAEKLQDILDGFITKFVLCPDCENPETCLLVSTKRNSISQACKACGFYGAIATNHRLNAFIFKNPPTSNPATQGSSVTEGNRGKRSKRSAKVSKSPDNAAASHVKATKRSETKGANISSDDDEEGWTVDTSDIAVKTRMLVLTDTAKSMTFSADNEKNEKQRLDLFYDFVNQRKTSDATDSKNIVSDIYYEAVRLDVKSKAPLVLFKLFIRPSNFAADLRANRSLFLRFTRSDERAEVNTLYAIDNMCVENKNLIVKVPNILKLLYDEDLVKEKSVSDWIQKKSKHIPEEISVELRKKAKPFLAWLQEAEEEEDNDSELEIDLRTSNDKIKNANRTEITSDDDFDIDTI